METVSMNIIENNINNINKLNDTNAMVIEFYDAFGWKADRTITKVGDDLYKADYIRVNGQLYTHTFTKDKLMKVIENTKVFNSYIINK